ncbi:hypothetical protein L6452_18536 [Arctium lappa]|uniref:Uncharacterized protein n=1 Tax=Arctium lappa TaxID=4217 RepID=A0ACB9C6K0_ARCLA|nr:hypothetical protein L6452_18536 [Arctium lappa]
MDSAKLAFQAQFYKNDLMMSLGTDTRLPILIDENKFTQWQDRFLNFIERQTNGANMMKSLTEGPFIKTNKEIPAAPDEVLQIKVDRELSANLMLALPNSVYNRVDHYKNYPNQMWEPLEKIMLESSVATQLRHTRFMNNFEEFKAKDISAMQIQELYEILMTDESFVIEKKAKLDKKNKKSVDPVALLTSQLAEQALSDNAYNGVTDDDGEALEKAMILLSQHYQKKFHHRSGSNNLHFASGSRVKVPERKTIACYNCGKTGHISKECKVKKVRDSAYYRKKLELVEKRENEIALLAEEEFWLDHSDDEAANVEIAQMCFVGDDQSNDDDDSSIDADEVPSEFDNKFISSQMNIFITVIHDLRLKTLSKSSKQIWRAKRISDEFQIDGINVSDDYALYSYDERAYFSDNLSHASHVKSNHYFPIRTATNKHEPKFKWVPKSQSDSKLQACHVKGNLKLSRLQHLHDQVDLDHQDMDPLSTTRVTPPSHSSISQKILVSHMHGDLAHNLSIPHSEVLDIEKGRHLLRSLNFIFYSPCLMLKSTQYCIQSRLLYIESGYKVETMKIKSFIQGGAGKDMKTSNTKVFKRFKRE